MKKQVLFILALISLYIAGCKIDEAGVPKKQSNPLLIGKWFIKVIYTTSPGFGTDVSTGFTSKDYYTFNTDNTLQYSSSVPDTLINSRYSYQSDQAGDRIIIADPVNNDLSTEVINNLTADSLIFSTTATATVNGTTTVFPQIYKLAHK